MKPLVSVICLCYNHGAYVRQAVESVLVQSYPNVEIIVWDDGSSDNSPSVIRQLNAEYPRLIIHLSESNEGNCRAFNRAFAETRGEYIIDFSADDLMHTERISRQVQKFSELDHTTGVVFTDATYIDESGAFIRHHFEHLIRRKLLNEIPEGHVFRQLLSTYFIASPTMMMRRSVLDLLGGYDEQLSYEDFDLWVRSARVFKYSYLAERLTFIRKVRTSMSANLYRIGDRQLHSTYLVCLKAVGLCYDDGDRAALVRRTRYELRHATLTQNHQEAELFSKLLKVLNAHTFQDGIWQMANQLRLPLRGLRRIYQWWTERV